MKVLKGNIKYLILGGVLSKAGSESEDATAYKILRFCAYFTINFGCIFSLSICSLIFVYQNQDSLSGILNAFICLFAGLSMFGANIGFISNKNNIKYVHEELQSIVDKGKDFSNFYHYVFVWTTSDMRINFKA